MEKILYFDCICGVSGDMTLAALLDLGLDKDKFLTEINKLNMNDEFELVIKNKQENGINGTNVCVNIKEHTHEHHHEGHHHHHRHLSDIHNIIDDADISDKAKEIAKDIFIQVATAEAKVHNTTIDKVHFHEVGATDSIVDIVGCAILIDMLDVDKIYCSSVPLGSGFVKCDHGIIPVPAPATIEILKKAKVKINSVKGETTTPTGAAIVKALSDEFLDDIELEIDSIGYGIGHKKFEVPNMLRLILGQKKESIVYEINANIDDMNSEIYSYLYEEMLNMGALDIYTQGIYMKKNRPAVKLCVLCEKENLNKTIEFILKETTTFGVRFNEFKREILDRKFIKLKTNYGNISIKIAYHKDKIVKYAPEYEECKIIARKYNIPLKDVYDNINYEVKRYLNM